MASTIISPSSPLVHHRAFIHSSHTAKQIPPCNNNFSGKTRTLLKSGRGKLKVRFSLQQLPDPGQLDSYVDSFQGVVSRAEGLLYTLADAAVSTADTAGSATAQKAGGGWFGFVADGLEGFLKVLKDGLTTVHIPYAYGFAIIMLTVLVKGATFPLTQKQ
ncbi:hypothetical protein KI387_005474, partial [Taxus chinensis]